MPRVQWLARVGHDRATDVHVLEWGFCWGPVSDVHHHEEHYCLTTILSQFSLYELVQAVVDLGRRNVLLRIHAVVLLYAPVSNSSNLRCSSFSAI